MWFSDYCKGCSDIQQLMDSEKTVVISDSAPALCKNRPVDLQICRTKDQILWSIFFSKYWTSACLDSMLYIYYIYLFSDGCGYMRYVPLNLCIKMQPLVSSTFKTGHDIDITDLFYVVMCPANLWRRLSRGSDNFFFSDGGSIVNRQQIHYKSFLLKSLHILERNCILSLSLLGS